MIEIKRPQELTRLRRLALDAQGLLQSLSFGRGLAGARKAIDHLGYVQIDTISVVERAHAAAFLPINDYRYSLPYKTSLWLLLPTAALPR